MAKQRKRSPHPGVVLLRPQGNRRTWRARFTDPDSGRLAWEALDADAARTLETRRDWAIAKARAIAKRRAELDGGAPRATGTALDAAIDRYFDDHPRLSPRTREIYAAAANKLKAWAARAGVTTADDLTGPRLVAFRAALAKEPKRVAVGGDRRGARRAAGEPRSASAVNVELRAVGTVLGYLRRLGLLPRLTGDDLRDGLAKLKAPPKRVRYLKPHELQRLLDAALRHDAETFKATRAEHAARAETGATPRYKPIAPVIAAALVTGLRFGHLLGLQWSDVDLDALDADGRAVGEIVPAGGSLTKRTGVIGLEISPALRKMLAAMKLASGGRGPVFNVTPGEARAALKRLRSEYGAPAGASWQMFRVTCGCYLTNAPGIFGGASAYRSAKQLGHSVAVAERYYVDVVRGLPRDARTVEDAMQIAEHMTRITAAIGAPDVRGKVPRLASV